MKENDMKYIVVMGIMLATIATSALAGRPDVTGGPLVTVKHDEDTSGPATLKDHPKKE